MIRVVCYTNAAQARLLLDGKEVGAVKPYDEKSGIIYWDIPYEAGCLTVEGLDKNGAVESTYSITSSGRPYKLKVTADKESFNHAGEVAHVVIEVLDENDNVVKLGDNEITCVVDGPAKLLGLEGSDNSDMGDYTDNKQRAYHGRLLAYIKSTGSGTVTLRFTSPLLQSATINL
jgi:hypothetical protein